MSTIGLTDLMGHPVVHLDFLEMPVQCRLSSIVDEARQQRLFATRPCNLQTTESHSLLWSARYASKLGPLPFKPQIFNSWRSHKTDWEGWKRNRCRNITLSPQCTTRSFSSFKQLELDGLSVKQNLILPFTCLRLIIDKLPVVMIVIASFNLS